MTAPPKPPRRPVREVHGILPLDKPAGVSSNRALQRAKRLFAAAKAGHTGSLDPLATGMLPICFGAATKVSGYLLGAEKTYRVVCRLGVATDTGDADGVVTETRDGVPPDVAAVAAAAAGLQGEIEQVPPMYSALKREGRRLYELAREGITVDRAPRRVRVRELAVDRYQWPELEFKVTCSKGTYVRSLVTDFAAALGTVGHVTALRRLAVGPFVERELVTFEQLEALAPAGFAALDAALLPVDRAVAEWPIVALQGAAAERFLHGQAVAASGAPAGMVRVYGERGLLLGLGEVSVGGEVQPRRLLAPVPNGRESRL